jgi:hypothetical protein
MTFKKENLWNLKLFCFNEFMIHFHYNFLIFLKRQFVVEKFTFLIIPHLIPTTSKHDIYCITYDYVIKLNLWFLSLVIFLVIIIYAICHMTSMTT